MIAVFGGLGNMGRRYVSIVKHLGLSPLVIDIGGSFSGKIDKAIISTPTDTHIGILSQAKSRYYLCEKPVDKDLGLIQITFDFIKRYGIDFRLCCNWQFAINSVLSDHLDAIVKGEAEIEYDCYNTGNDGTAWDCIQLIHLAGPKNITIKTESPIMRCLVKTKRNPKGYEVTTRDIEVSYVQMIQAWLKFPEQLWGIEESLQAHREVLEYIQLHPEHG